MLEFYATSGDFTRRLTDIRANAKFSSPLAGPEDLYSVRALNPNWLLNPHSHVTDICVDAKVSSPHAGPEGLHLVRALHPPVVTPAAGVVLEQAAVRFAAHQPLALTGRPPAWHGLDVHRPCRASLLEVWGYHLSVEVMRFGATMLSRASQSTGSLFLYR